MNYDYYGDIRYFDGTQAPTSDEWEYDTIKKFDDMSERDLEDLFNNLSEAIERNNPDLSSIEGLLNAIYARLGTLDSDDDNGLLTQINTSIQSLNSSISDIETSINDLKETITFLFSSEDKLDDSGTVKKEVLRKLYFFVHTDEIRQAYDTYERVERLASKGYKPRSEQQFSGLKFSLSDLDLPKS